MKMKKISNIFRRVIAPFFTGILFVVFALWLSLQQIKVRNDVVFLIQEKSSIRDISHQLTQQGIIYQRISFYLFAQIYTKIYHKPIIPGEYALNAGSRAVDLLKIFTEGKVIQHVFMVPEGFTVQQVLNKLKGLKNIQHFPDQLTMIQEGSLLPETYFYTHGTLDIHILKRMKRMMRVFLENEWSKRDKRVDKILQSVEEVIVLASIVEKETYLDSEKPLIAGVYLNRLKRNMRLQADPTVIYGLGLNDSKAWNRRLMYSHLKIDSPYNTYMYKGLPPTPICNPGRKSILAVLHPEWTEKLFFVDNGGGRHIFASNFEQHKKNIDLVRQDQ